MTLTTASGKLRSTILFSSREDQVLYKRSSADLAGSMGITPSEAVARLPIEALAHSELARGAAEVLYSEEGDCRRTYEFLFVEWSAVPPAGDSPAVVCSFFSLCHRLGLCIDTTEEAASGLVSNWEDAGALLEEAAGEDLEMAREQVQAKQWRQAEELLRRPTPLLSITPLLSLVIESWRALRRERCTYRILSALARSGKPSSSSLGESLQDRLGLLRALDELAES